MYELLTGLRPYSPAKKTDLVMRIALRYYNVRLFSSRQPTFRIWKGRDMTLLEC